MVEVLEVGVEDAGAGAGAGGGDEIFDVGGAGVAADGLAGQPERADDRFDAVAVVKELVDLVELVTGALRRPAR